MARTMALAAVATAGESNALPTPLVAEGRKRAAHLHDLLIGCLQLKAGSSTTLYDYEPVRLAKQILLCFDRALAKLRGVAGTEDDDVAAGNGRKRKPERGSAGAPAATSSKRMRASSDGGNGARFEKKATMDDEFLWRKYGQKEIKNSKHPRFYYRCSYKDDHGCTATKQVQQSETDPSVFDISYFGEHTCQPGTDDAAVVVDGGEELSPAQMVISFASSGGHASVCWPCSGDDARIKSESSQESSFPEAGEEEQLRQCTDNVSDEPILESTPPVPELPDLKPMDGLFDMDELIYFHELSAALGLFDRDCGAPVGSNRQNFTSCLD